MSLRLRVLRIPGRDSVRGVEGSSEATDSLSVTHLVVCERRTGTLFDYVEFRYRLCLPNEGSSIRASTKSPELYEYLDGDNVRFGPV